MAAEVKQKTMEGLIDELRAKILGLLQAPAQQLASVVAAPGAGLARVIGAHSRKEEAA